MLFNVPQNINVEDKIAGPLTGKQLLWMFGMGGVLLVLYLMLPQFAFYAVAFPVAIIFLALAFFRPNGQALPVYVVAFFFFLFRPKIYIWKRSMEVKKAKVDVGKLPQKVEKKSLTSEQLSGFARILDTRGLENNSAALEMIRKRQEAVLAKKK